ncbi:MAG: DEAD/DEAH box helicase family protein [Defluviicoccus sp.]|nr:DEAD/DEAH box helicase family protein [Defluviicoccus sp.]
MIELRPYQSAAIEAIYGYFADKAGNPLIVLPTASGKSVCIAEFMRRAIADWPDTRILVITHVKELIAQNYAEMIRLWPDAPAGIYSAGLNKRDLHAQILFAGIQSIHKRAYDIQRCDLALIDECHLCPRTSDTMYRRFLGDLTTINPHLKVIGFTATPYRLDSGMLHEGDGALFTDIAYEAGVADMIAQGYLSEVVPKRTETQLDTTGVGSRGGEFIPGQLEAACDVAAVTEGAVDEIVRHGADRGSWLVFCAGVRHAEHVRDAIRSRGFACEAILGETASAERDQVIAAFKRGTIRCLTNANVLTTGFNAPGVDLIAMLRPTKSVGLYVQMIGRGTRLANGKQDCLVLDFAGNVERHGPIDRIDGRRRKKDDEPGSAPVKTCPDCRTIVHASVRQCPTCGHLFPPSQPDLSHTASTSAILSSQIRSQRLTVTGISYHRHEKPGSPPSLRVEYACGLASHREWVCFEHTGYARQKAVQWWQKRLPDRPVPRTVAEVLVLSEQLPVPVRISVRPQGRYTEITGYELQKCSATSAAARPAASAGSTQPSRSTTPGSGFVTSAPSPARTSAIGDRA